MEPPTSMNEQTPSRGVATALLLLFGGILLLHLYAVVVRAGREPHMDETEYLHAGWMMRNGERLYETFFEHHSPLFFGTLSLLAPEGEAVPARPFFVQARWLAGAFGGLALLSLGLALKRAGPEAPVLAVALLFATGSLWLRGFADARAEPFALAFFLGGAALILRFRGAASGLGLALVAASAIWNPKWPIASIAIGLVFLSREWRNLRAWAAAAAGFLTTLLITHLIVPLDVWWFFNFDVNVALSREVQNSQWALDAFFAGGVPFLFVPDAFGPLIMIPAALIVAAGLVVKPDVARAWPLALLAAAFVELRFILPWPAIWSHYYLMWAVASAATLAVTPASAFVVMKRFAGTARIAGLVRGVLATAGIVVVAAHVLAVSPVTGDSATYWVSERWLRERLRPGDTVWLEPPRHPVTIRDAHYYWFSVGQMVRAAQHLRGTERGRRYLPPPDDLPACAPPATLRYMLDPARHRLEEAAACLQQLSATGQARRTVFADVWEVRLIKSPEAPQGKALP